VQLNGSSHCIKVPLKPNKNNYLEMAVCKSGCLKSVGK